MDFLQSFSKIFFSEKNLVDFFAVAIQGLKLTSLLLALLVSLFFARGRKKETEGVGRRGGDTYPGAGYVYAPTHGQIYLRDL